MENKEQNLKERSKQTAVEWFESQLEQQAMISVYAFEDQLFCRKLIQQAKAMEKEQHFDTWTDSRIENKGDNYIGKEKSFEEYYKEAYGEDD